MSRQPINYGLNVVNPVDSILSGINTGFGIQDAMMQRAMQEQSRQQAIKAAEQQRMDIIALTNPETSENDIIQFGLKYPKLKEATKMALESKGEERKASAINRMSEVYSAVKQGDAESARRILKDQFEAAKNSKNSEMAIEAKKRLNLLDSNPDMLKTHLAIGLDSVGIDLTKLGGSDQYELLTPEEIKEFKLDPEISYQRNIKTGQIKDIASGGVVVNIDEKGKVPSGWQRITKPDGTTELQPEPGGEIDRKLKEAEKRKIKSEEVVATGQSVVLDSIDSAINQIQDAKLPIVGVVASKIAPNFRQKRVDLQNKIKTIQANIGFDRLQQMREASKTGGALGAVSERELETLQAVLGSLDLAQSEQQIIDNLSTIKTIIDKDERYRKRIASRISENIQSARDVENLVNKYKGAK